MRQLWRGLAVAAAFLFGVSFLAAAEETVKKLKFERIDHSKDTVELKQADEVKKLIESLKDEKVKKFLEDLTDGKITQVTADKPPNPLDLKWDLGLWTIVIFLLLLLILRKVAWGPMLEGLKKREESIKGAVEEAKLARAETQKVAAEFKAKMDQAYAEIPKMMDEARRDAQRLAEDLKAKGLADIAAERQRLRREIETAKDQALKELQEFAADLATRISAKVLKRMVSADDHRRLVDEALGEMRQAGKGA